MSRYGLLVWFAFCLIGVFRVGEPVVAQQAHDTEYQQADIDRGERLFNANCASCHGPNGDAVPGITLLNGRFRRQYSDDDLRGIITNGISSTAMPRGNFSPQEVTGLVAYIRSRASSRNGVSIGSPEAGKVIFEGKGACQTCHRVNGNGSRLGPDLSTAGETLSPDILRRILVEPNGSLRPSNRSIRAVTKDGAVIIGRRLNEDMFTVQLIDTEERLRSLAKSNLREYAILTEARMPSYQDKLTSSEIAGLIGYLSSLRNR